MADLIIVVWVSNQMIIVFLQLAIIVISPCRVSGRRKTESWKGTKPKMIHSFRHLNEWVSLQFDLLL